MKQLPNKIPKVQIITSARHLGGIPERIPFIGLSIRPFTPSQRDGFIRAWFKTNLKALTVAAKSEEIITHLKENHGLAEIVTNPLNATILCVLAENGIPLPEREVGLYSERKRLLFGDYDIHKQAKRLESRSELLNDVAIKLAYYLHSHNLREESLDDLTKEALRIFEGRRYSPDIISRAVSELVDPCYILVPMNALGDYCFGHLRFQEYFVASELRANRNIKLAPKLYSEWWRGPLVLLAQMSDDIESLFREAIDKSHMENALPTLNAMLRDRSAAEVKRLDKWLEHYTCDEEQGEPHSREYYENDDDELPQDMQLSIVPSWEKI